MGSLRRALAGGLAESWLIVRQTAGAFVDNDGLRLSAAVSFFAALSLAPIAVIALALAGTIWDTAEAQARVVEHVTDLIGARGAEVVHAVLANASEEGAGLATMTSLAVVVLGSTAVFAELESALNQIWRVQVPPGKTLRSFLRRRLVSAVVVVVVSSLLVVSLAASAAITVVQTRVPGGVDLGAAWRVAYLPLSFGALAAIFAAVFKLMPAAVIAWRDVWVGGVVSALLFLVGRELIGYYLAHTTLDSSYGAAGSLVVLLLWVYYSSLIFFAGAELTHVLARRRAVKGDDQPRS